MSEPTYRVDLDHHPEEMYPWRASIIRLSDETFIKSCVALSREEAFAEALRIVVAIKNPERSSSVYLSEDGDLLDPHEVQR